jgi:hypothetical protein
MTEYVMRMKVFAESEFGRSRAWLSALAVKPQVRVITGLQ